jgi:hypothetical protein
MGIQLPDARQLSEEALDVIRLRALRGIELGLIQAKSPGGGEQEI